MKINCIFALALTFGLSAHADTVKDCSIDSMMPYLEGSLTQFIDSAMKYKGIAYDPTSITFKSLGKERWQEYPFLQPDEENAFEVSFQTEKGNVMNLVTPQHQSYGDPQLRDKLTLLIPNPVVKEIRDAEGNLVKRQCQLMSHQGYNRWLFIVNTTLNNFLAYDALVSCSGCEGGTPVLGTADLPQ